MEYMNDPIECPECDNEIPLGAMMCPHCGYDISEEMQEYMVELEFLNRFNEIKNIDPEVAKLAKKQEKRSKKIALASAALTIDIASILSLLEYSESLGSLGDTLGVVSIILLPILIVYLIFTSIGNKRRGKKIRKICEQRYGLRYN